VDFSAQRIAIRRSAVLVKERGKAERREQLASIETRLASSTAYVFPGDHGGVAHPERFSRRFNAATVRARKWLARRTGATEQVDVDLLPTIRLHDLRHTHATMLLTAGVHPKVVQERLGHQTIAITMDLYSHVQPTTQRDAVTRFRSSLQP